MTSTAWPTALLVCAGTDAAALAEHATAAAASLSGGAARRTDKALPASIDVFGWCTWDAFYSRVSAAGVAEGVASLARGGAPPRTLVLDDGWQCTELDPPYRKARPQPPLPSSGGAAAAAVQGSGLLAPPSPPPSPQPASPLAPSTPEPAGSTRRLPSWEDVSTDLPAVVRRVEAAVEEVATDARAAAAAAIATLEEIEAGAEYEREAAERRALEATARDAPPGSALGAALARLAPLPDDAQGGEPPVPEQHAAPPSLAVSRPRPSDGAGAVGIALVSAAWVVAAGVQRAVGAALGAAEAAAARAYLAIVDQAPASSWRVRAFQALATGPLRPFMLEFYAASGDFTRRLTSVRANSKFSAPHARADDYWSRTPDDLAAVVASLHTHHGVRHIIAWHSLSAYWGGVAPEESGHEGVSRYGARLVYASPTPGVAEVEPSMLWSPAVLAGVGVVADPATLYADLHAYLAAAGVDGVKVDGQAGAGLLGGVLGGGPAAAARFQSALEGSVETHFPGNHVTNCMCHSTENLFRTRATAMVRASDDFYPRDPASSSPHVTACAYNTVFLAGVLHPDYDMFHSRHPAARLHAVARAVSGGPVYVSDAPGAHDFSLLKKLVLPDGRILRARLPGRPTADVLFRDVARDGVTLLKLWNANPHTGVVGVLHVQGSAWCRVARRFVTHDDAPPPLATTVRPRDVVGVVGESERDWVAYMQGSARVTALARGAGIDVALEAGGATVVTLAPVVRVTPDTGFAAVGLKAMLNGGGAVADVRADASARAVSVRVTGSGEFIAWASAEPASIRDDDGAPLAWTHDASTGTLTIAPQAEGGLDWGLTVEW